MTWESFEITVGNGMLGAILGPKDLLGAILGPTEMFLEMVKCSIACHVIFLFAQIVCKRIVSIVIEIFVPIRIY